MSTDRSRVNFEVPTPQKEMLDEIFEHGERSEVFRDVVDTIIGMEGYDRQTVFDARIERKQDELEQLRDQRDDLDARIDAVHDELDDLRRQRENVLSREDEYRGALKALEWDLRRRPDGPDDTSTLRCVWDEHPRIQGLANEYNKQASTVIADLRDRNPDVPAEAFHEGVLNQTYRGLPAHQARRGVDEREGPGGEGK